MENYKLQQRLGKGAQGSVFLVDNKSDGKKYVLKKVECSDENEANKAFKEAMALQELQHPYICGYKEFFVTWDKDESAMFVCIVMEYYKMGDLDKALKQKRAKSTAIEELILKKWFGQMLEAIVFVHNKQVIHRDLKPSNIFMTEDLNISIGDFGVSTIMGDARTKTRTTVGSMNWMAPEVLERPYDERSDVWSLGCILLEMATCGFLDASQISSILFQIKSSPQVLEEALEQVGKTYSKDLCQIIRTMLRRNFQQRVTALELLELPYVKECLAISGSKLVENDETVKNVKGKKGKKVAKPVPKEKGVEAVIAYMKDNESNSTCQTNALKALNELVKKGKDVSNGAKKLIASIMRKHIAKEEVQTAGCRLLATLAAQAEEEDDVLYTRQLISPVALAMKSHSSSVKLQAAATQLLMALSADETAAKEIGKLGGVQDTLAAMRAFPDNVEIATNCCGALWSLAIDELNAKIVCEERGLQDICRAMENHDEVSDLIEAGCSAIWSLSMEDDNIEMMSDVGAVKLLLQALKTHKKEAKVVKNACMALASIVEADESSAYEVLHNEGDTPGAVILISAYKLHKDNEEVVENFACCVAELAEYEDVRTELKGKNVHELLADIKLKFASNGDVISQINNALVSLGEAKEGMVRNGTARSRPRSAAKK
ncbi:serine/threonine kinase-like domain-containing protein STKLD1 [Hydractinia symbiolongicarpus]|uniref:serine/threonine kinase-like domain-containing protein STKLD1 n=1 Tax=Hydractinia symbiolongicarpus TaxID=13093 RepID=UPI00254DC479|nr:serine/threonine kinase-like domain-containing protein STKLD1 [Hydractinia symbiolongicarpus]